jgi:hypothetical protein
MGKKFIKSLFVVLSLVVLFSLFSCEKRETLEPEIKGVNPQMTAYTGDVFDFMAGITATDKYGKDVTNKVKYYTAAPMDENGVLIQSGEYSVRYELEINGVVLTQEYAMLKVIFKKPDGPSDNMIFNGDFSSGYTDPFILSQFENGTGTFGVENEELFINITNIAAAQASPRIDYNDLQLDPDKFYEVRFEARANVPRWMHIQIGQLIDQAPWFYSVDPIERFFYLDTTMQSYSFRFQPSTNEGADMSKISLLLEFGKMKEEAILTTCFLDNIVMEEVDSLGEDTTPPTITAPTEHSAYVGEELNVPVTAFDDFDKDITDKLEVSGDEIPVDENGLLTTEGEYTLIYTVKDTAGNEASASVLVKVLPPREFADPDNLFGTPDDEVAYDAAGAGSEENSKKNPNKWHIWNISDAAWGIGPVTDLVYTYVDGVLTIDIKQNENPNFWANQVFYTTLPFKVGGQFVLTLTINSNKAGTIMVAGEAIDLVEGDNHVEVTITVNDKEAFTLALQAGTADIGPVGDIVLKLSNPAITVKDDVVYADPDNLFGTPSDEVAYDATGIGSEENSKKNPNKWHIWNISDASWGIGPVTTLNYTYVDGVLTIDVKQNENPNFWANQVFYTTLPFEEGGSFVVNIKITSDKAGKISIAGVDVPLVEGENNLEIPITVGAKQAFTFGITFGTANDGPVGDIVLSILEVKIEKDEEGEEPVYADPDNILGTITAESLYLESGIAEEADAKTNPNKFVIWNDLGGWIGTPSTVIYTIDNATLNLTITQPAGSCWFAAQVFYYSLPLENGGTFALTFELNSNKAGKITVNNNVIDIVEGLNEIKVKVTVEALAQFPVSIQFGVESENTNIGDCIVQISALKATPWVEEEPEKLPTPVGLVANNMGDTNLYTAWAHVENAVGYKLYIYNEQNEEVKTLTVTNGQNTPFEELGLPGGTYYAKLQAIGDGVNYLDSDLSAPSANFIVPSNEPGEPKKLATPVGFVAEIIEETNLYTAWAPTAGELFKAYIYNTEDTEVKVITVVNGGLIPLTELDLPAGSYYAKLQAIGDGVNTLDSDLSAPSGTFIIS